MPKYIRTTAATYHSTIFPSCKHRRQSLLLSVSENLFLLQVSSQLSESCSSVQRSTIHLLHELVLAEAVFTSVKAAYNESLLIVLQLLL